MLTTTSYYPDNHVHTVTRNGLTTSTRTYEDGRVKTDTDALNRVVTYGYDHAGRKTKEERPLASVLSWTYTPMGDVETARDADKRVTTNSYTKWRYLDAARNNAGETTRCDYDGEGHQTSMQRPAAGHNWQFTYDDADRLSTVTDAFGTTTYGYDADGNRTSQGSVATDASCASKSPG